MIGKMRIIIPILLFAVLAACSNDSREITMHEAGLYKGTKDPLMAKDLHQELNDRFKMIQTDR